MFKICQLARSTGCLDDRSLRPSYFGKELEISRPPKSTKYVQQTDSATIYTKIVIIKKTYFDFIDMHELINFFFFFFFFEE
jgi:hypothetical protein